MEIREPPPPLLDEFDSTAPEQRSPANPPMNWGVFLVGHQEMKSMYSTVLSITVITLQS